jgi:hypothetical protein
MTKFLVSRPAIALSSLIVRRPPVNRPARRRATIGVLLDQ